MGKTAIQEDVVEEESVDIEEPEVNIEEPELARDSIADDIAARVAKQRKEENVQEEELEEEEEVEEVEDTPVDLKVDGEIVKVTQQEVDNAGGVAEMQKSLTADKRLQQVAEELQSFL